ncbi:transglutaminase-like domain-containing protein [Thalassobaculum sp.]|uniref:transglutaminase-like domain-containing protein n=1 Tax=Thalassobaculum sp. TaxID=2022740 RepID=UPI0032EF7228
MTPEAAGALLDSVAAAGDTPLAIAEAALALAVLDRAGAGGGPVDLMPCRAALVAIETAVADAEARGIEPQSALAAGIAGRLGYRGDDETYDDLANADLIQVIERRCGLPVALGILYIHAARQQGHLAAGLNVPGHFLIGVEVAGHRYALDPFNGGEPIEPQALRVLLQRVGPGADSAQAAMTAVSDRAVLLRLQNNIKLRRLQSGDTAGGLAALARMRRMAPEAPELVSEEAGVLAASGSMRAATATLRAWLDAGHGGGEARAALQSQLASIGSRLN